MSADVEQAAEEYSKERLRHQVDEIALIQAFLAGRSYALTPRKIDWSKPATQPPLKTPVLCFVSNQKEKYWYVGFRENVGGDSVMRMTIWGNTAPMPDYYLPLPPTPQGER